MGIINKTYLTGLLVRLSEFSFVKSLAWFKKLVTVTIDIGEVWQQYKQNTVAIYRGAQVIKLSHILSMGYIL